MYDFTSVMKTIAMQTGTVCDGTYRFYETDLYNFVQIMQNKMIDEIEAWRASAQRSGLHPDYIAGYVHAMEDAVEAVKHIGRDSDSN
jgi:hypothetical protein